MSTLHAKAAVMEEVGRPLVVADIEVAEPEDHEILVRTAAAGLCHSDLLFLEGSWPHPVPTILGHEVTGTVEAVGPEVTGFTPGDTVIGCAGGGCYRCRFCVVGRPLLCEGREAHERPPGAAPRLSRGGQPVHQYGQLSGFSTLLLVHEDAAVRIPPEIPPLLAAILGCAVATGLGAVFNTARVDPGDSVVVTGCGGVGLSAIQGARIAGAGTIVAVDVVPMKLELARTLGATEVVDASEDDRIERVLDLTGGGAAHVIEASGVGRVAEETIAMAAPGGTIVLVGLPAQGTRISFDPATLIPGERVIRGSHVGSLRPTIDIPRYAGMYLRGQLLLEPLVSTRISLRAVNDGFAAMGRGEVARAVIEFARNE
jgi:S-(hydroxymethyl)glutathione dehydrogenase / alcohol dehydrogenase